MTPAKGGPKDMRGWYKVAGELGLGERYCTCCERKLRGEVRMLELDQRGHVYHDLQDVPSDKSQGWFPFGLTCARKLVATEIKRRSLTVPSQDRGTP